MDNNSPLKTSRVKDDQYELAIRIIAHYRDRAGKGVQWSMINMPGRNVKSMQNMFTKINEDIRNLGIETSPAPTSSATPSTTGKKRGRPTKTPKGKKAAKSDAQVGDGETDDDVSNPETPCTPPKKRIAKAKTPTGDSSTPKDIKEEVKEFDQGLVKSDLEMFPNEV